jgi:small subunit ribosomal protein S8
MTMTDPIADMLTRIRNANVAMHDDVTMPSSKLKEALATLLEKEGYISSFEAADRDGRPGRDLTIQMKYSPERQRVISGLKRVSSPGLRVYRKADEVPRVLGGLGVAVLSTSQGLMTDREARKRRVGGEVLCYVW